MAGPSAPADERTIVVIHTNDQYSLEPRKQEPVGGAARMATKIKSFGETALVLFSGDAFNPSLLSTLTQGKQMVEVLNSFGTKAACVGNHDFDYGLESFEQRAAECTFPWLMANVLDAESGKPLGGARPTLLLDWQGVRVGLVGLVEREWLTTLASVDEDEVTYLDFVEEGGRRAQELREAGAEVVLALTHMRLPNDLKLAAAVPGIDAVLGGHDHEYSLIESQPYGTPVVKSGTDFQSLTEVHITLTRGGPGSLSAAAQEGEQALPACPWAHPAHVPGLVGSPLGSPGGVATAAQQGSEATLRASGQDGGDAAAVYKRFADASLATALCTLRAAGGVAGQPGGGPAVSVRCVRHSITSDLEEDAEVAAIVERYSRVMGERMDLPVGESGTDLDGRFATVRTGESNLGNFVCDVWREACHADAALCNGGTFRSDRVHPAGVLTHRDLVSVLPMLDDTVVIEVTGEQLVAALESGVSQWPKHEGRFPQVSGIRFAFDPTQPPGSRVVPGSVEVGGEPVEAQRRYSLATKQYLAEGKDGYSALQGARLLCDADCTPLLPTVIMNHFLLLRTANRYMENTGRLPAWRRAAERLLKGSNAYASKSQQRLQAAGVSHTARKHPVSGRWQIAPVLDGRIRQVGAEADGGGDLDGPVADQAVQQA